MLALGVLGAGYTQLLARTCSGQETVRVLASPSTARHLSTFANEWRRGEPATEDGTCGRVVVDSGGSSEVAADLAAGWDESDEAPPPDVWVPSAAAWAHRAAFSDTAEAVIPDVRPSIARSPTVFAMPEPMAAELGWPDVTLGGEEELRWETLLRQVGEDGDGWAEFGRPEWGDFRFGMGNPSRDTAGLLALSAILDATEDGETDQEELEHAYTLSRLLDEEIYHETTDQLLTRLDQADRDGEEAVLRHVSAFPALEQEVLAYNRGNPEVQLSALYPVDSTIEADHPYLILNAEWVTDRKREVAEDFLAYVRSEPVQQSLRDAGFRGTDREPGGDMVPGNGVVPELIALPRAALQPESVALTIDQWTALTRQMNVLMAFDVSGSMLQEVPGTGEVRLDRAKAAATDVVELFADEDRFGFWEFSTERDDDLDYRSLIPVGQLDDLMDDGRLRRDHTLDAIAGLEPDGDTGLYNTIQAAYDTVLAGYDSEAINMVVVVTDGENDTGDRPGVSLEGLLDHLREAPGDGQQVRVATVAFGEEPDFEVMQEISRVTGGQAYYSDDGFELRELLRAAVFSGIS